MKDKHNVILSLISSKGLIPYSGGSSYHILGSTCFIFSFPRVPSFRNYISTEVHLNHCKASTLFFSSSISFDHTFITRVPHGGSSRILFILQLFFKISLEAMIRQNILQVFFFSQSGVHPFFRIIGDGIMSFLII